MKGPHFRVDAEEALRRIVEGVAAESGDRFFEALVKSLAEALRVHGAWVTDYLPESRRLRARAFWLDGRWVPDYEYALAGTPCDPVVTNCRLVHIPERVVELFPDDPDLKSAGAVSYLGLPLLDLDGTVLGHLALLDTRPFPEDPLCLAVFQIFAARAAAELRRLRAEDRVREGEGRIRALALEADYLRHEVEELGSFREIVGRSEPILRVLRDVKQVADTDATVLLLGETGTGKELVARAVHSASRRADRPFVKVNCATLPAALVESELFGHEKGAFTGATQRRDGRFALADGGTIFLDEIGEMPPELQPKLLRVLQEGEFDPVGSSRTRRVDVRVVAATNRDLAREVREGRFREDLFYRLNVFPIALPPLRERGEDVVLLAKAAARRAAERFGRPCPELTDACARRLLAYDWPGNVRELQNVIERAVITGRGGRLDLDRALPPAGAESSDRGDLEPSPGRIRSASEMEEAERQNILLALRRAEWRVAGPKGAATLLGLKPSTLASRMKALGIRRSS